MTSDLHFYNVVQRSLVASLMFLFDEKYEKSLSASFSNKKNSDKKKGVAYVLIWLSWFINVWFTHFLSTRPVTWNVPKQATPERWLSALLLFAELPPYFPKSPVKSPSSLRTWKLFPTLRLSPTTRIHLLRCVSATLVRLLYLFDTQKRYLVKSPTFVP